MENQDTILSWVLQIAETVRKATLIQLNARGPIPFGVKVHQDQKIALAANEAAVLDELRRPSEVFGMGECLGLQVRLSKRLDDWFLLVEAVIGGAEQEAAQDLDPFLVKGRLCLTKEEACWVAIQVKTREIRHGDTFTDDMVKNAIMAKFTAHFGLNLAHDSLLMQVTEIRRLVRENTLFALHGLEPGLK